MRGKACYAVQQLTYIVKSDLLEISVLGILCSY